MRIIDLHKRRFVKPAPNTFLGGVGGIAINTVDDFLNVINESNNGITLSASDIKFFRVVGDEVQVNISKNYNIGLGIENYNASYWQWGSILTYYLDDENKLVGFYGARNFASQALTWVEFQGLSSVNYQLFRNTNPEYIIFPNVLALDDYAFYNFRDAADVIYIPRCTNLGSNTFYLYSRNSNTHKKRIYVHPSILTNNGGGLDENLVYAQSHGANIIAVEDFTPPSSITDLSITNIAGNSCDLNFTPPTSANALDFYEVYVDDGNRLNQYKPFDEVTASGQTISGLPYGNLKISVRARDEYYNGSEKSNEVEITI